ncbi:unnamed protein product [Heligmosomoides polygyrus]|uniref:Secreted protein n=1 Tax=Heligmosomoides polygyrus TaxID=6339 RepID=A0A183FYT5_HELPZ|nr:unnamed protein product [Heligmosomoides polygyrus]
MSTVSAAQQFRTEKCTFSASIAGLTAALRSGAVCCVATAFMRGAQNRSHRWPDEMLSTWDDQSITDRSSCRQQVWIVGCQPVRRAATEHESVAVRAVRSGGPEGARARRF